MTKARIKRPSYKHMDIYIYIQGRIQDLAQGGNKSGAKPPKICLYPPLANSVPPLRSSGGG